jgi:hypothetical protein
MPTLSILINLPQGHYDALELDVDEIQQTTGGEPFPDDLKRGVVRALLANAAYARADEAARRHGLI